MKQILKPVCEPEWKELVRLCLKKAVPPRSWRRWAGRRSLLEAKLDEFLPLRLTDSFKLCLNSLPSLEVKETRFIILSKSGVYAGALHHMPRRSI